MNQKIGSIKTKSMALLKHFFILTMILGSQLSLKAQYCNSEVMSLPSKIEPSVILGVRTINQDSSILQPNFYISLDASVLTLGLINLEAPFGESELHLRGKSGGTTYISHYFRVYTGVAAAWGTGAMKGLGAAYTGVLGRANHHMDISVGATYSGREGVASSLWPKVDLGYRYQKPDGGFLFKVFATTIGVGAGIGSTF